MSANDKQFGGDHYNKDGEQHWDRMWRLYGRGYFVASATKYLERYHLKNGLGDLQKAIHFTEKLIELEYPGVEVAVDCPECNDSGTIVAGNGMINCPRCNPRDFSV